MGAKEDLESMFKGINYYCDYCNVSLSSDKNAGACAASKLKMTVCASCECRYIDNLCFLFLLYQCKLDNVAVSFVFEFVVCNKSELV